MKYNKQDLPKIVALSVVLVGLIIYIGKIGRAHV